MRWAPRRFTRDARAWDAGYDEPSARGHQRRCRVVTAVRAAGSGPGAVLDAGVGSGRFLAEVAGRGWRGFGIDVSPEMIALARRRVPRAAGRLAIGRLEALPYAAGSFDVVVALGVLEYTDVDVAVPELIRVTRPGGRLVLGLRNGGAPVWLWRRYVLRILRRWTGRAGSNPAPRITSRRAFARFVARWEIAVERIVAASCAIVPEPLDRWFPRTAARTAALAERSALLTRLFGTQFVLMARRPGATAGLTPPHAETAAR
jgi:SAM-dependent methyltransferase